MQDQFEREKMDMESQLTQFKRAKAQDDQEIANLRFNIEQFSSKIREYSTIGDKCDDMEAKIGMATEEIERLNRVLKERNAELRDNQNKLFEAEERSRTLENEFNRMRNRL